MEGHTQVEVGEMLGWKQQRVGQYKNLQNIDKDAWEIITTTLKNMVVNENNSAVVSNTTVVVFSERLLRSIIPLSPDQQYQLISKLAANNRAKSKGIQKA